MVLLLVLVLVSLLIKKYTLRITSLTQSFIHASVIGVRKAIEMLWILALVLLVWQRSITEEKRDPRKSRDHILL